MIRCGECGFVNEDDDAFCGDCRALLRWTGEHVEAQQPDDAADESAEEAGLFRRVVDALAGPEDDVESTQPVEPAQAQGRPSEGATSEVALEADRALAEAEEVERQRAAAAAEAAAAARAADEARQQARAQLEDIDGQSPDTSAGADAEADARNPGHRDADRIAAQAALAEAESAASDAAREAAAAERQRREAESRRRARAEAAARAKRAASLLAPAHPSAPPPAQPRVRPAGEQRESTTGQASGVAPVHPQAAQPAGPAAGQASQPSRPRPGELVCGACGTGNKPTRSFCRACGESLAESEAVRVPWWQRIIGRGRSRTSGRARAGRRGIGRSVRKARRSVASILRMVAIVSITAGMLGIATVGSIRTPVMEWAQGVVEAVVGFFNPPIVPVTPIDASASTTLEGTDANHLINNSSDQWWAEALATHGVGARVTFTFEEPVDIVEVAVTPGSPEDFTASPRPRVLRLIFDNGTTHRIELEDANETQVRKIEDAEGVEEVTVRVMRVYQGLENHDMAITAFEFSRRR